MVLSNCKLHKLTPAVAYVRAPSDDQAGSVPKQREIIARHAELHGFRVVRWYEDDGRWQLRK